MQWLEDLRRLLDDAVRLSCTDRVGVVFSAGVDSTLVAYMASEHANVTGYAVGMKDSTDLEYAMRIKAEAPFKVETVELSLELVESTIPKVLAVWPDSNPIDVGVGLPMHLASEAAAKDGQDVMLCGQGGDELFGGYWRYLEKMVAEGPDAVVKSMESDFASADKDNLDRDRALNRANGQELRFPFLEKVFSDYVRAMPLDLKIRQDADITCDVVAGRRYARKYALKKLAEAVGVPDYVVHRVKKAAQYGSGTHKALDKVARAKGYKTKAAEYCRKDYLNMYLEDLVSG